MDETWHEERRRALGLAVPLVVAVSTSIAAANGLLIRDRTAFEEARRTQAIVFDKTGTLTKGEFGITDVLVLDKAMNCRTRQTGQDGDLRPDWR
jgi:P-type E1-E2 ATPase